MGALLPLSTAWKLHLSRLSPRLEYKRSLSPLATCLTGAKTSFHLGDVGGVKMR
jgi:hypothetical protein